MTRKIFFKLIGWVFLLMLLALVMVDYLATNVAKENYIQNLTAQLADKGRMIALVSAGSASITPEAARVSRSGRRRTPHRRALRWQGAGR